MSEENFRFRHSEAKPKESKTSLDNPTTLMALFVPLERMDPSLHYRCVQNDESGKSLDQTLRFGGMTL